MHFFKDIIMLLVHVPKLTNRIGYTLNVVLGCVLHCDFEITTDKKTFLSHEGERLCYGPERLCDDCVWIKSTLLLLQSSIMEQEPGNCESEGVKAIFPVFGRNLDFNFDLLAAAFFMVSRYEEYLPHHTDEHGRFLPSDSIAYHNGFLREPVVDQWAYMLAEKIREKFPTFEVPHNNFHFEVTVDIDAAFRYRNKGVWRTILGFWKDLVLNYKPEDARARLTALFHKSTDPYNTFDIILNLQERYPKTSLIFFALLGDYGIFDKNISYQNEEFRQLLKHLGDYAKVGIHNSYASHKFPHLLDIESDRLKDILHNATSRSRSHFLLLTLPHTYRALTRANIRHDYTMGYAEEPGFRAGISVPYPFYDLARDGEMPLTIHPFCLTDATLKRSLGLSNEEAYKLYCSLVDKTRSVNGTFCYIMHNQYLNDQFGWDGWLEQTEKAWAYGASSSHPS